MTTFGRPVDLASFRFAFHSRSQHEQNQFKENKNTRAEKEATSIFFLHRFIRIQSNSTVIAYILHVPMNESGIY